MQSDAAIAAFTSGHPECGVDTDQPAYRGGTNRVTFGRVGDRLIVFKYFVTPDRYANELACLRHIGPTGLVPEVLATSERLIVMSRLAGTGLHTVSPPDAPALSEQIGRALGRLGRLALPEPAASSGYSPARDFTAILWGRDVHAALRAYIDRSRNVLDVLPRDLVPFFGASLDLVESHADWVAAQRPILFHEDVHNLTVAGGRFVGFYDLEMCRLGTEAMQLGVALRLCAAGPLSWPRLLGGYERQTGRQLDPRDATAALAMHHFYHWIRICRWGLWDGSASAGDYRAAAITYAERHRGEMEFATRLTDGWREAFPGEASSPQ